MSILGKFYFSLKHKINDKLNEINDYNKAQSYLEDSNFIVLKRDCFSHYKYNWHHNVMGFTIFNSLNDGNTDKEILCKIYSDKDFRYFNIKSKNEEYFILPKNKTKVLLFCNDYKKENGNKKIEEFILNDKSLLHFHIIVNAINELNFNRIYGFKTDNEKNRIDSEQAVSEKLTVRKIKLARSKVNSHNFDSLSL